METNELPEEVKAKIEEWINDGPDGYPIDDAGIWMVKKLTEAAEFGYRLAQSLLQQRDEELKAKDEEIEQIDSISSEVARLRALVEKLTLYHHRLHFKAINRQTG